MAVFNPINLQRLKDFCNITGTYLGIDSISFYDRSVKVFDDITIKNFIENSWNTAYYLRSTKVIDDKVIGTCTFSLNDIITGEQWKNEKYDPNIKFVFDANNKYTIFETWGLNYLLMDGWPNIYIGDPSSLYDPVIFKASRKIEFNLGVYTPNITPGGLANPAKINPYVPPVKTPPPVNNPTNAINTNPVVTTGTTNAELIAGLSNTELYLIGGAALIALYMVMK